MLSPPQISSEQNRHYDAHLDIINQSVKHQKSAVCAHTYLDIHQVNTFFLKIFIHLLASPRQKVVTLQRQKKQRLIEAWENRTTLNLENLFIRLYRY